jgi:hypothetical protein
MDGPPAPSNGPHWAARAQWVDFDLHGFSGHYWEVTPQVGAQWRKIHWTVSAPYIFLSARGENHAGLGNAVGLVEFSPSAPWSWGAQLEIPTGDEDKGLGADHPEFLPYGKFTRSRGGWRASLLGGFRYSLDQGHGHAAGGIPLIVNPHEDKELLARVVVVRPAGTAMPQFTVDWQQPLDGEDQGTGFWTAGARLRRSLGPRWSAEALWQFPLSRPRRFENKVSLLVRYL